jgi:heme A synthase
MPPSAAGSTVENESPALGQMQSVPSRRFRLVAAAAALAAWTLVSVGGVVRVTESGLGCPHWPLCTSQAIPLDQRASVIEYSHRALVALTSVLAIAVAAWAWHSYRARDDVVWPALLAVILVPFQALLGAVAVWLELPGWVVAFHFVVGLLFLGTIVFVAAAAWRPSAPTATVGFTRLARGGVLVGLVLVSVGAAVVATDADAACGQQWPTCNGSFAAGGGHADLQVAHRMLAYATVALAFALFVLAIRGHGPRLAGSLPFLAVLVQMGFGIAIVLVGGEGRAHEILSGLHVAGAATVWAALVALTALARPAEKRLPARGLATSIPARS